MLSWIRVPVPRSRKFLFLDRDGVVNVDSPYYIKSWNEFRFYPDALQALRWLNARGVEVILVSNQSGLERGLTDWDDFWDLHERMIARIREEGGELLAAFYCPHRPDQACTCRKPLPGMILAASELFEISLPGTFLIGDKATDVQAAQAAGCSGVRIRRTPPEPGETVDTVPAGTTPSFFTGKEHFPTLRDAVEAVFAG